MKIKKTPKILLVIFFIIPVIILLAFTVFSNISDKLIGKDKKLKLNTNVDYGAKITTAISKGDYAQVEDIFIRGLDIDTPNIKGDSPLMSSIRYKQPKIRDLILSLYPDINKPNKIGDRPILLATKQNDFETIKILTISGADLNVKNNYGSTPVLASINLGNKDMARHFITYGSTAGINSDNFFKYIAKKNMLGIEVFLIGGISPNVFDSSGNTALIIASANGDGKLVSLMLKYKANLNIVNKYGTSALIYSVMKENKQIAKYLVNKGADVNIINKKGETAIFWASYHGYDDIVKLLLEKNANPTVKTKKGITPYGIAEKRYQKKVIRLFRKYNIRS